jgi:hypothetical protein
MAISKDKFRTAIMEANFSKDITISLAPLSANLEIKPGNFVLQTMSLDFVEHLATKIAKKPFGFNKFT